MNAARAPGQRHALDTARGDSRPLRPQHASTGTPTGPDAVALHFCFSCPQPAMHHHRDLLVRFMHDLLEADRYADYAPNGLQVEGRPEVARVAFAVSANAASIAKAAAWGADMLVCHHGFFWKNEPRTLVGHRAERVGGLFRANMSLVAWHLPLDGHDTLGNARVLLDALGAEDAGPFGPSKPELGRLGRFSPALTTQDLEARITSVLDRAPLALGPDRPIETLAVVTGSAASMITDAADRGASAFLTGEPSEQSQGLAQELGLRFYAAGHHATERGGLQRLQARLAEEFGVETCFMEVDNPV